MSKCTPQATKCTPQLEKESIFRTVFDGWLRFGGIFRRSLRATTKKVVRQLFWQKKCPSPADKILATPMSRSLFEMKQHTWNLTNPAPMISLCFSQWLALVLLPQCFMYAILFHWLVSVSSCFITLCTSGCIDVFIYSAGQLKECLMIDWLSKA